MIEFAILLHLRRNSEEKVLSKFYKTTELFPVTAEAEANNTSEDALKNDKSVSLVNKSVKKEKRNFVYNSHKIDYIALVIFGLLFCAFNSIYWVYYLLF